MALTTQQIEGLNAAYQRQQTGSANETDLANLKYASGLGYKPPTNTPTVVPPTVVPDASTPSPSGQTNDTVKTEISPGVLSASKLKNFYDQRLDLIKPQAESAQAKLADIATQMDTLAKPDYQSLYDTQYTSAVAPIDQQITDVSSKVNAIDDNLRKLEDDVRAEIGGRAPESIIQAEVARRAKPLELQRQTYVDQYSTLSSQKTAAESAIEKKLTYQQQSYNDQLSLLDKQQSLAKDTLSEYNSLMEKGQAATDKEVDNFRQMFSTLLTNAPDVLKTATADEMQQLQSGFVPQSLMNKIGETINEQKITQQKQGKIFGSAASGYFTMGADGKAVELVPASAGGMTPSQRMNAAVNLMSANPYITSLDEALRQIDQLSGAYVGSQAGGSPSDVDLSNLSVSSTKLMKDMTPQELSLIQEAMQNREGYFPGSIAYKTNNPGNIKFGDFARSLGAVDSGIKGQDGGTFAKFPSYEAGKAAQMALLKSGGYSNLTLDSAMKRWSNNGYGAEIVGNGPSSAGLLSGVVASGKSTQKVQSEIDKLLTPPSKVMRKDSKYLDAATTQSKAFAAEQKVKDYNDITSAYGRVISAQDNAAGDLSLIFAYMKMLDPGSVVREGEFATAQNAAGIPDKIKNAYNNALNGERLGANQRAQFKNQAKDIIGQSEKQYLGIVKFYADRARSAGIDPKDVVATFSYLAPDNSSPVTQVSDLRTKYAY